MIIAPVHAKHNVADQSISTTNTIQFSYITERIFSSTTSCIASNCHDASKAFRTTRQAYTEASITTLGHASP